MTENIYKPYKKINVMINKVLYEKLNNFNLFNFNFDLLNLRYNYRLSITEAIFGEIDLNIFYDMEYIIGLRHYY